MPYIFDKGRPIEPGVHGEHDFVYSKGTPVPDTGASELTFEAGTGIGRAWSLVAEMPTARREQYIGDLGGEVYVAMGDDESGSLTALEKYNPLSDSWSVLANSLRPLEGGPDGFYDGKFYCAGGSGDNPGGDDRNVLIYDPGTDSWSEGAQAPIEVGNWSGQFIGSVMYCAGRDTNNNPVGYAYDANADSWSSIADPPFGPGNEPHGVYNGEMYVGGGKDADVIKYDPGTDSWSTVSTHPSPSDAAVGDVDAVDGKLYQVGGDTHPKETWVYDIVNDTWSQLEDAPVGFFDGVGTIQEGSLYCIGGKPTENNSSVQSATARLSIR